MIAKHPGECKPHAYQDSVYGKGFRVMNPSSPKASTPMYRCTVCCPTKTKSSHRGGEYDVKQLIILRH